MGTRRANHRKKPSITDTTEWHVLLISISLFLLYLTVLTIGFAISPPTANKIVAITVTNMLFGRAAGMSLGYAMGYGHLLVIPLNIYIESVMVLLFYPLFVFSCQHVIHFRRFNRFVERIRTTAEKNQGLVNSYGLFGLFIFVWFPFSMTGPMVGCVIGYLMGLDTKRNLTIVLLSTTIAIISWELLLRGLLERLAVYGTYAPITIVTTVIALIFIIYVYRAVSRKKGTRG